MRLTFFGRILLQNEEENFNDLNNQRNVSFHSIWSEELISSANFLTQFIPCNGSFRRDKEQSSIDLNRNELKWTGSRRRRHSNVILCTNKFYHSLFSLSNMCFILIWFDVPLVLPMHSWIAPSLKHFEVLQQHFNHPNPIPNFYLLMD